MADTFVLFVDILGFADLVKAAPNVAAEMEPQTDSLRLMAEALNDEDPAQLLEYRFHAFHSVLESEIGRFVRNGITSIVFSDSAFIQLDSPYWLAGFAIGLMQAMLIKNVPVRMGIGMGTFNALRFASENTARTRTQASQFLGSAVVRAYEAERSGTKSLSILLDPRVVPAIDGIEEGEWVTKSVPLAVATEAASHQLNYLSIFYEPSDAGTTGIFHTNGDGLIQHVRRMRTFAPEEKRFFYSNTEEAINEMKQQWGEA